MATWFKRRGTHFQLEENFKSFEEEAMGEPTNFFSIDESIQLWLVTSVVK